MTNTDVQVFRASTAGIAIDAFCEHFGRNILKLEMMALGEHPLTCDVTIRAWEDLAIASGYLSPMSNRHPASLGDDGLVLCTLRSGTGELRQTRGTVAVPGGAAVLTHSEEAGTFTGFTPTQVSNIRLRRELLAEHIADPMAGLGQAIDASNGALRLLMSYTDVLADPKVNADAGIRQVVTRHFYDLAVLALGGARDARAHAGGVRAARLNAIRNDIGRNLTDPALSIGSVAQRHSISASYVRRLFATTGTSFADHVLEQRLALAHRMLRDRKLAHRPISAIAYDVGFGDLSYFNRTFRRRYGMTPSDVRAGG